MSYLLKRLFVSLILFTPAFASAPLVRMHHFPISAMRLPALAFLPHRGAF